MTDKYILDGKKVVPVADLLEWAKWFESCDRRIARDEKNGVVVSTIFLGLDHQFGGGPPLLFQTVASGGPHDQDQERYSTWEDAEAGHKAMCERVFGREATP